MILALFPSWLWHPLGYCPYALHSHAYLDCRSYGFWSGIGSDIGEITLLAIFFTGVITVWRVWHHWKENHACHVEGCSKTIWHVHPDHGHPVCKLHHPDYGHEKLSAHAHFLRKSAP